MKSIRPVYASLLALAMAGPAWADDQLVNVALVPNPVISGAASSGWGVTHIEAGSFTDTISFSNASLGSGFLSSVLATIGFTGSTDIDFTSVSVNGQAYSLQGVGGIDFAAIGPVSFDSPVQITVAGIAAPALGLGTAISASYAGTLNVSPVPEPHSVALMLAGLGAMSFVGLRRRKS